MPGRPSRRLRLLALLSATVLFAAGVLFIKYQMEGVRARVEQLASEKTGSNLTLGRVRVTGLRGSRSKNSARAIAVARVHQFSFTCPSALLFVDVAIFDGRINIQQIRIDGAEVEVVRDPQGAWLGNAEGSVAPQVKANPSRNRPAGGTVAQPRKAERVYQADAPPIAARSSWRPRPCAAFPEDPYRRHLRSHRIHSAHVPLPHRGRNTARPQSGTWWAIPLILVV